MPLILPGNVATATASTGYNVANSCRFNDGDSPDIRRTFGSAGDLDKWTFSCWYKRSAISSGTQRLFGAGSNNTTIYFSSSDQLAFYDATLDTGWDVQDTNHTKFRDSSAWYHIVWTLDSAQAVAANRVKCYINGTQQTLTKSGSGGDQNFTTAINTAAAHFIGKRPTHDTGYLDGYLAEVVFNDGQAYAASDYGEFDEDSPTIWKPKDVSGLTFGTNGFYLDFEDSGTLGNDANGGTDWTATNLAATDQSIDTCTNNFATMNPLDNFHQGTAFSEGNLKLVYTSGNRTWNTCNVALSSGKWYCEILKGETNNDKIGIHYKLSAGLTDRADSDSGAWSYLGGKNADDGGVKTGGSTITYTIDPSDSGDIVQLFLDLDNNKLYFGVNGTVAHSGVGIDIPAASTLENGHYYIFGGSSNTSETMTHTWNFGSPAVAISSANTDAEGFGSFEFSPSGTFDSASKDFLAICTKNLAEYGG